jgi:hypothetical protein
MEDIKTSIRATLQATGEATAKQIAKATGHSETEVINALNTMRVYAEVECEQKGRGKGMTYWLAKVEAEPARKIPAPKYNPDDVAFGKVPDATKKLREQLALAEQQRDEHFAVAEQLSSKVKATESALIEKADRVEFLEAQIGHYRIQIDALNEQLMTGEDVVDIKDAARGYLVCAPKRKPAKLLKAESAVARAKSAAKAAGRSEVFALVPVGVATRKQVLAVEFKERVA